MAKKKGRMSIELKHKEVAFAAVTGEGIRNKKAKKNQYSLAIIVGEKDKKEILKQVKDLFKEHAPCDEMDNDPKEWFKENKEGDGYVLFLNCQTDEDARVPLTRQRAAGTSWSLEHFESMGSGSVVDVKFNLYIYGDEDECGVGRALNAILLREWVEYSGGGFGDEGESIDNDSDVTMKDKYADLIEDIEELIEDGDKKGAKKALKELPKSHKKFELLKTLIKEL